MMGGKLAVSLGGILTLSIALATSAYADFDTPGYPSTDCSPVVSFGHLGLVPQQWNSAVGLPLVPDGTPESQRIVIGEFDQTANLEAVNALLIQCGLDPVSMTMHASSGGHGAPQIRLESTLDVTVVSGALPAEASITLVNTAGADGWLGMFINIAEACGLEFAADPWAEPTAPTPGPDYPPGGCIASISYGAAETIVGDVSRADWLLDQLAANGVIVVTSAGDEGSGGCLSSSGRNFGDATGVPLTSLQAAGNVATLTSAAPHGFSVDQQVFIGAVAPHDDGIYRILSIPSDTTFTVAWATPDQGPTSIAAIASVDFGGPVPQYPAVNPTVLAVGGTQWRPQVESLAFGLQIPYAPGLPTRNYTWWDSNANSNCANLPGYPVSGGEGTGGGQSATYAMPVYQQPAVASNYSGLPARRMIPDVAALAGWPAYALANPGITVQGAGLQNNVATVYTATAHGISVDELIDVALLPAPFDSFNNTPHTVTAVTATTLSFAMPEADIAPAYVASGNVSQTCATPCSASQFPWYPVVGTSAATALTAVGIANVNAALSARGLPRLTTDGGDMDVHHVVYDPSNGPAFTDVVDGSNDIHSLGGYTALTGFDMTTGMGVPNFSTLAGLLVARLTPVVADLGHGVLVSTGPKSAATTRAGTSARATKRLVTAPRIRMPRGRWRVPNVTVPVTSRDLMAQIRIEGSWQSLGSVPSTRRGKVLLPSILLPRAGRYPVRLMDERGGTFFVNLRATR